MTKPKKKKNKVREVIMVYFPIVFSFFLLLEVIIPNGTSTEIITNKDAYTSTTHSNTLKHGSRSSTETVTTIMTNKSVFRCPNYVYQKINDGDQIIIEKSRILGEVHSVKTTEYLFDNLSSLASGFYWKAILQILFTIGLLINFKFNKKWHPLLALPNFFLTLFIVLNVLFEG